MNSTISATTFFSAPCKLPSRTMNRLIRWNKRNCFSVLSSCCSSSRIRLDTNFIMAQFVCDVVQVQHRCVIIKYKCSTGPLGAQIVKSV